jgi:demethoxyubiquinone hydroxylase (CLK1/Coq7/Cat5 family)
VPGRELSGGPVESLEGRSSAQERAATRAMLDRMLRWLVFRVFTLDTRQCHSRSADLGPRVDHAGEYGADRIYAGQLAVLGNTEVG